MRLKWCLGFFAGVGLLAAPALAAWQFKIVEDPMTDAKRGIASIMGDDGGIVVKCDSNGPGTLYVSIISKGYLGGTRSDRSRSVKYRVDGGEIQSVIAWHDGRTATILEAKPGTPGGMFISQLMKSSKIVVQTTSFDSDIYTISLDTSGAANAIKQSAMACGDGLWTSF